MDQKVLLKVEGMDCANCAQTITRTLTKDGLKEVNVDFLTGEVTFSVVETGTVTNAVNSINKLGYRVKERSDEIENIVSTDNVRVESKTERRFLISLIFTIPLLLHMFLPWSLLHNPFFQLALSIPVMIIGVIQFGKSAYYSIKVRVPNMDVLIFIGSTSAFIYSLSGVIMYYGTPAVHDYLFFETAAAIITLVLLGNLIEQRSVKQTTNAITQLSLLQPEYAKKLIVAEGKETTHEINVAQLVPGDVVMVNTGDRVPTDGKITFGQASVNESMLTGESKPVFKTVDDLITGGTLVEDGSLRLIVEHTGKDTLLAKIIELVKSAQRSKPTIQKLGDKISAVFVPVVIGISVLTFFITLFYRDLSVSQSLMNSIAVLVISCPCAMGLATPTAVMVGLGRAARNGILIKGGSTIEELSKVRTIVFDKTGTLTTGQFRIKNIQCLEGDELEIRKLLYSLEKHSSHPIANSIQKELKAQVNGEVTWKQIQEDKGIGINATDEGGTLYSVGSFQMVKHFYKDLDHELYLLKNNRLIATVDLEDEVKPGVSEIITELKRRGIRVALLSGDRKKNCESVALKTGIEEVYFEKLPAEKLTVLDQLMKESPTAMIGDGINDAPSLARATVGISISDATQVAIQSAQVILLAGHNMDILLRALRISDLTYKTIRQNLFWAFFYNIIAIPFAAAGFLSPMIGALSMAFSDVFVIGNSLRLRNRNIG